MQFVKSSRSYRTLVWIVACVCCSFGGELLQLEDLSGCERVHANKVVMYESGSPKGLKGYILSLKTCGMAIAPWEADESVPKPRGHEAWLQAIQEAGTGDLVYSTLNGGTLVAVSGKVTRLGAGLLSELDGRILERPATIMGTEEKGADGKGLRGVVENAGLGDRFLIETIGGSFALVRIISTKDRGVELQWVMSKGKPLEFDMTGAKMIDQPKTDENKQSVASSDPPQRLDVTSVRPVSDRDLTTHLDNRDKVIRDLLAYLQREDGAVTDKVAVVKALGRMRAAEAASMLALMINLMDKQAFGGVAIDNLFPCVPALVSIGKPGSAACLARCVNDEVEDDEVSHLALVLVRVEGKLSAKAMVESALEEAADVAARDRLQKLAQVVDGLVLPDD